MCRDVGNILDTIYTLIMTAYINIKNDDTRIVLNLNT